MVLRVFFLRNDINTEVMFETDMQRVNPLYTMDNVNDALNNKKITFEYYKKILATYNTIYDASFLMQSNE